MVRRSLNLRPRECPEARDAPRTRWLEGHPNVPAVVPEQTSGRGTASAGAPPQRMPRSSLSIGLVSVRASRPSTTEAPPIDVQYGVWLSAEKYPPSTPDRAVPTPEARKNTAISCDWNTFGETFVENDRPTGEMSSSPKTNTARMSATQSSGVSFAPPSA